MTAAARPARKPGKASNMIKALGNVGSAILAKLAAAMAPRPTSDAPYVARVTRDYGKTWEEWPFAGYGSGR